MSRGESNFCDRRHTRPKSASVSSRAMASDAPEKASAKATGQPAKAKVFISYSRRDMTFADQLEIALKARGFSAAIDRSEIYAFEEWWKRIETLITQADTVVFVLSPDSVASEVALKE